VSSFEFILVSIAIVVGFGISEILAGWGRQLRHRHDVRPYPLQVVASAYLLALSLRYLWTLWIFRGIEWTYAGYLLVAVAGMVVALAAHLTRVEVDDLRRSPRDQYFAAGRPFFLLLAAFPVLGAVNALGNARYLTARFETASGPFAIIWPLALATSLWLAFSRDPRHHWVGWAILWGINVAVSVQVLPTLGPGS
jgi:hypothetical protein